MSQKNIHIRFLFLNLVTAALYYGGAQMGLLLAFREVPITPVWPPTGIALAAILLQGWKIWPGIFVGTFLVNIVNGLSPLAAGWISVGNTLEPVIAALLLSRLTQFDNRLKRQQDVMGLLASGASVGPAIAATAGVLVLHLAGRISWAAAPSVWLTWWIGDAVGVLVVAPVVLAWAAKPSIPSGIRWWHVAEGTLLLAIPMIVEWKFYGQLDHPHFLFPFLIWAALRFRVVGAATASFVVAIIAILFSSAGYVVQVGIFANEGLFNFIGLLSATSATALILAAIVEERDASEAQLVRSKEALEVLVRERTTLLYDMNARLQRELSERVVAEVQLRKWAKIFENAEWGIAVASVEDRSLRMVNAAYAKFHGCTAEEMQGMKIADTYPARLHTQMEFNLTKIVELGHHTYDSMHVRKDGTEFPVTIDASLQREEDGSAKYFLVYLQDITERIKAEESVRRLEERYRILAKNLPDSAVFLVDRDFRFILAEGTELDRPGFRKDLIEGKTLDEALPADLATAIESDLRTMMRGEAFTAEFPFRDSYYIFRYAPLRGEDGCVEYGMVLAQNITDRKRVEEVLEESERRFRHILSNVRLFSMMLDQEGNITFMNEHALTVTGYTADEIIGTNWFEQFVLDPAAYASFKDSLQRGDIPAHFENEVLRKDGSKRIVRWNNTVLRDAHGTVMGTASIGEDITERRQMENALRDSEHRLTSLIETVPNGIVIADKNGTIGFANREAERILELTVKDLQSRTYNETQWRIEAVEGGPFPDAELPFVRVQNEQKAVMGIEYAIGFPDGRRTIVSVNAVPLYDADGSFAAMLSTVTDVTNKRLVEQMIRETLELNESILRTSPVGVGTYDESGQCISCNEALAQIVGKGIEEVRRQNVRQLASWKDSGLLQVAEDVLSSGEQRSGEFVVHTSGGKDVWLRCDVVPLRMRNRSHLLLIASDITQRKRAEVEEVRGQARTKSFLAIIQQEASSVHEWLDFALDEAIKLTESKIGYIYFYSEEREEFTLNSWSKGVMKECAITEPRTIYALNKTGFWGEAVRQRKPIMSNDFAAAHPLKKGFPAGHAKLKKFLTVPIFQGNRIVAVVGVANKEADYEDADVTQLSFLMNSVWKEAERKRADEAMRDSEERFRSLFELADDAIFVLHGDRFIECNPTTTLMFGCTREEIIGQSPQRFSPVVQPNGRLSSELAMERISEALAGTAQRFEWIHCRLDGSTFDAEVSLNRLVLATDTYVQAIVRDISERKRAEEELRRSNQLVTDVLRSASEVSIIASDPTGIITVFNRGAERMLGYTAAEMVGKQTPLAVHVGMEVVARGRELSERLGVPIEGFETITHLARMEGMEQSVWTYVRKDGTNFPVSLVVTAMRTSDGSIVGYLGIGQDITERIRAERELRKKTAELDRFFSVSVDLFCILDSDGRFARINQQWERTLGYRMEDLIEHPFISFVHPDDLLTTRNAIEDLVVGKEVLSFVNRYRHAGGRYRWLEWRTASLGGNIFAAARNITERIETDKKIAAHAEELSRSNQELEQFAYVASHDLQEPLRMVSSYTQLLARRYKGKLDADADEFIQFAVSGAVRMQALIKSLLTYSRVTRDRTPAAMIDAEAVLNDVRGNLKVAIDESRAEITSESMPIVRGNHLQLLQVFQNLIGNAIKFRGDRAPHVHVGARRIENAWEFTVQDNGIGIDAQFFERIFIIFQRLHTDKQFEGTGIGLALCRKIVEQHGGRISVASTPGEGTTITFSIADQQEIS